jgi:hypothetical protein
MGRLRSAQKHIHLMSICKSVSKFDALPPCYAAPFVTLDQGHRPSRTARSLLRVARIFLSDLVDSAPFQEVSLRREASILFTGYGPLVYRWDANNGDKPESVGRQRIPKAAFCVGREGYKAGSLIKEGG